MPNPNVPPPEPPKCLSQIPKSVVRALDLSEVFLDALISMKHSEIYGPVIALHMIESYFDAAKRQQLRIERAKSEIHSSFPRATGVRRGRNLFYDFHFYIISWARIARLANWICEKTRFRRTGRLYRRYRGFLKNLIDARDHLEHLEDRLPGGKYQNKLDYPNDLLNMRNQYLTYGGRRVDIGPDSIRLLKTILDKFRTAILFDSLEVIAKENPSRLSFLFQRAASKVQTTRSTRKIKRMLKDST